MPDSIKLKVCGMKFADNTALVAALKPDYLGFIFFPGSARYVGDQPDPALFSGVPAGIRKIGVFVDAGYDEISRRIAGQCARQQKRDDDHADQARYGDERSLQDHSQHGKPPVTTFGS